MLRQAADEDSHRLDFVELPDPVLGEDVDHSRRETTVGDDRDVLLFCGGIERLLLEHDLGVSTEIREVHARLHCQLRQLEIEVVGNRAHHSVGLTHQREHRFPVTDIERREYQSIARVRREKMLEVAGVQIGESNCLYIRILQQVICARGALQPRAKY